MDASESIEEARTKDLISDLERRRYKAVVDKELDVFASLCDEKFVYTHSNGARDSLESYLKKCREGYYVYHSIEHPIDDIVVVGDVAVVIGDMNAHITAAGKTKELNNAAIAVWVNVGDSWKFLAYQPTPRHMVKPWKPG